MVSEKIVSIFCEARKKGQMAIKAPVKSCFIQRYFIVKFGQRNDGFLKKLAVNGSENKDIKVLNGMSEVVRTFFDNKVRAVVRKMKGKNYELVNLVKEE